jgi:methionine S-methyltransferase
MTNNIVLEKRLTDFLSICKQSSEQAIHALSSLVLQLENTTTQKESAQLLQSIVQFLADKDESEVRKTYHFHFFTMDIPTGLNDSFPIVLLQLPSTFAPEEWSFTFFEGLSRYSFSEFQNKKMVELGCGNGWISLSMALKFNCSKIYGLDINPKAILCSKINLFLNAFDTNGELKVLQDGETLLDKVEFHTSDLLSHFYADPIIKFDVIIGCIPQVLAPQEGIDNSKINADANDEFLHSLSNYTSEQGYVEDKFGLGLIARSVEESIDLLKSEGKLILNLGERPRREVLERLVRRRGMLIKRIWKRKVGQANDTDIDSLVRLEKEMNHHFEFYTDLHSEVPINARTAKLYASKGGAIYHNLSVYECTFDYYTETKLLFDGLKDELFAEAKIGLDLDYDDRNKKEEKIRFLAELTRTLKNTNHFPYEDNQGEIEFRKSLSNFLNAYQHIDITENHFLIAPNLESLIDNILDVYSPPTVFLSESVFSKFSTELNHTEAICTPNCSKELNDLIKTICPQVVIAKIENDSMFTWESVQKIVDVCEQSKTRLFIDISACFDLSSSPESNGVFQYLSKHEMPLHVSFVCELSKNEVYTDLKTCFLISSNTTLLEDLKNAAEFSYSRSPYLSQLFYTVLVKDLTSFHMKTQKSGAQVHQLKEEDSSFKNAFISRTSQAERAFNHASIQGNSLKVDAETIRFDYGENELACPDDLKISILESFTRQSFLEDETNPESEIRSFVANRFGIEKAPYLFYGNGVAPLFAAICKSIKEEEGTLLMPQGAYGYFYATALFYDVEIKEIPTFKQNGFVLTNEELEKSISSVSKPYVFINYPLINPTGSFMDDTSIQSLLEAKGIEKSRLIIDTVFSGLEFDGVKNSTVFSNYDLKMIVLGGISKEYSAGGIRFGYALTNFACHLDKFLLFTPHSTVNYTVKKLISKHNTGDVRIKKALSQQTTILFKRANELADVLTHYGWDVIQPKGGLFLIASPVSLMGKKVCCSFQNEPVECSAKNLTKILHDQLNILINNDEWTGISGYCRFVLSIGEKDFYTGLERIRAFHQNFETDEV